MPTASMCSNPAMETYSAREIALAAGVPENDVRTALAAAGLGDERAYHAAAVRIGRSLIARADRSRRGTPPSLFSVFSRSTLQRRSNGVPFALSSTLHAGCIAAAVFITGFSTVPSAATANIDLRSISMSFVFLATPGPGGGGGGGGLQQPAPPPKALQEGVRRASSPVPRREPPRPIVPVVAPPEPPLLRAEPLPALIAPIVATPADLRTRVGVLEEIRASAESRGPGGGRGVGTGAGTGIGEGDGSGVGPGLGGGIGGGPFRPGSGIEAPRLLREIKADYTEEARRLNLEGDVLLEIVVKGDGTVANVRILKTLGAGLDQRAVQAVRQWRFLPAQRLGAPVDVIVEVSVEFKLR